MISRTQAEQAQRTLGEQLNFPQWLRGIGIMHDPAGSHFLKVNVQTLTSEVRSLLPSEVDGVPIRIHEVGSFTAHRKTANER